MQIEIGAIEGALELDEPRRLPAREEAFARALAARRQRQIKADETIERPDERHRAENPVADPAHREIHVKAVDEGHDVVLASRQPMPRDAPEFMAVDRIEMEEFEIERRRAVARLHADRDRAWMAQ